MTTFYNINELKILPDGSSVTVCGIITRTRRIPPVKDPTKFIVVGNIEDSTGEIEFVALHKILKKYNSLLEPENKVVITGKYKKQEYSFIEVKTVMPYKEYFKKLYYGNKNKKDKQRNIYTGFTDLDKLTDGFKGGELILISGCPAMGKTSFVSNLVLNIGANTEKRLVAFLPKMSHIQFLKRIIGISLGEDFHKIKSSRIDKENCEKPQKPRVHISICLDDTKNINNNYIEGKCVFWRIKLDRLDLVIINDLKHLKCNEPIVNRKEKIGQILTGLKNLAVELNIPVVVISQLSKRVEKRDDKHPLLTDLTDSSMNEIPDKILFLYRDDYYDLSDSEKRNTAKIIVAKNNTGETGTVNLLFDKEKQKFWNIEENVFVFNQISSISKNSFTAKYGDYWFEIDTNGKLLYKMKCQNLRRISNDLLITKINNKEGLIDNDFNVVAGFEYSDFKTLDKNFEYFKFRKNKKWGVVDKQGKIIIEPKYSKIERADKDFNYMFVTLDGKKYLIDRLENTIDEETAEKLICTPEFVENSDIIEKPTWRIIQINDKYGLIDNNLNQLKIHIENINKIPEIIVF